MRKLTSGVGVHLGKGISREAVQISSGVDLVGAVYLPRNDWRPLSAEEGRILFDTPYSQSRTVGVVALPARFLKAFHEKILLDKNMISLKGATAAVDHYNRLLQRLVAMNELEVVIRKVEKFLSSSIGDRPVARCLFSANPSGQYTTTVNKSSNTKLGLHLDSWDKYGLAERDQSSNRICINLGLEKRSFLFCNLPLVEILRQCSKPGLETEEVIQEFFTKNPDYPVIRVDLNPGEAYIAPTENILHDGSTVSQTSLDLALTLWGHFRPDVQVSSGSIQSFLKSIVPKARLASAVVKPLDLSHLDINLVGIGLDISKRIEITPGIVKKPYDENSNSYFPRDAWQKVGKELMSRVVTESKGELHREFWIFSFPKELKVEFDALGLSNPPSNKNEHEYMMGELLPKFEPHMKNYLEKRFFEDVQITDHALNFTPARRESTVINPETKRGFGLHIDNWGLPRQTALHRDEYGGRFGFNMGDSPRQILLSGITVATMLERLRKVNPRLGEEYAQLMNLTPLVKAYFDHFPDTPILMATVNPYEGYYLPVQNVIHDGYTMKMKTIDINLQISSDRWKLRK